MREPNRIWLRHRRFVRGHGCCVPYCQETDIEVAHVRDAENSGVGLKPADWFTVSLCRAHHAEAHLGEETFCAKHGIDLWKLAAEFAAKSPDSAMRLEMPLDRRMSK